MLLGLEAEAEREEHQRREAEREAERQRVDPEREAARLAALEAKYKRQYGSRWQEVMPKSYGGEYCARKPP